VNQDSFKADRYEDKEGMGESLEMKPMTQERRKNEGCRF